MKTIVLAACVVVGTATAAVAGQATAAGGGAPCDRACLLQIADAYLAALVAHAPSKAPLAPKARFTEQAEVLAVGEGLWKTATEGPSTFKIAVPDPVAGQIGMIVMMKANLPPAAPAPNAGAQPPAAPGPVDVQLALRLKVQNRQITEAEHLIARITAPGQLANLRAPRPNLLATVPPAERTPRRLMLVIAHSYYDAIEQSDGTVAPFADDCGRRENGMHTAGAGAPPPPPGGRGGGPGGLTIQGCAAQLTSRVMSYIDSIDLRRVWIADEQTGLAFGMTMFRHSMKEKAVTVVNPDGTTRQQAMNFNPFDLPAAHIFKISGQQIHEIEAMGFMMPYQSRNGWSPFLR